MDGGADGGAASAAEKPIDLALIHCLPFELLLDILQRVDPKTLIRVVPAVCQRWRAACAELTNVVIDLTHLAVESDILFAGAGPDRSKLTVALGSIFRNTTAIDLSMLVVQDDAIATLVERCPKIVSAKFVGCMFLTNQAVLALAEGLPNLTTVSISSGSVLDSGVIALARNCPQLKNVDFSLNPFLTDKCVIELSERCPRLVSFGFANCTSLSDRGLTALAQRCPRLEMINITGCFVLSKRSVKALAEHCPEIVAVEFSGCRGAVTDDSIVLLAERCPRLSRANFSGCSLLTNPGIASFASNCPRLESIALEDCQHLSDASILALVNSCPHLYRVQFQGLWQVPRGGE